MDEESVKSLLSSEARGLVKKYSNYLDNELEDLMLRSGSIDRNVLRAVVTMIKLRRKAKLKFKLADEMFFTSDGVEQSTGENIAAYVAGRFGQGKKIMDLTCSIGGNLLQLAQHNQVVAVDRSAVNLHCARLNADVYGVSKNIEFVFGDAEKNLRSDVDAFFIDPDRSRSGNTKTRSFLNSSPSIVELLPKIFEITQNVGIKISPAFDYEEVKTLPGNPEIEIISEKNECKVAMLWFGEFKTCERRATCFIDGSIFTFIDDDSDADNDFDATIKKYIYEPNKAIIKAHLITEIAASIGVRRLDDNLAYLSGNNLVVHPYARVFEVLSYTIFSKKATMQMLKENRIERVNIMTRRFPVEITELFKIFKLKEGGEFFLIFTTVVGKRISILTRVIK